MADDDWTIEVTKLLLEEFDGRAKFGQFKRRLYQRNLVKHGISQVITRMSNSDRFLVFAKDEQLKYVSIAWEDAGICFGYRKRGWDTCRKDNCSKFHVCKFFISGNCVRGSRCLFGHDLENEANERVSDSLGLSSFSAEEIRTIIFRSHPAVCVKYNTGGCDDDDCPDLHVGLHKGAARIGCNLGHSLQTTEHNQWVLDAFRVKDLNDDELRKRILVQNLTKDNGLRSQMTRTVSSTNVVSDSLNEHQETPEGASDTPVQVAPGGSETIDVKESPKSSETEVATESPTEAQIESLETSHVQKQILEGKREGTIISPAQKVLAGVQTGSTNIIPKEEATVSPVQESRVKNQRRATTASPVQNNVQDADLSRYQFICETYTWTGACSTSDCPRYHSSHHLPYLWLFYDEEDGTWRRTFADVLFEECFCHPDDHELTIATNFSEMSYRDAKGHARRLRRLSTPSYVAATPGTPLNFYTQWVWYRRERDGTYTPFYPGTLQYTLEEKYLKGQHKYYFEFEDLRLRVDTHTSRLIQTNLDSQRFTKLLRRPVCVLAENSDAPQTSPLLLSDTPNPMHQVPKHWTAVDHFQDFELVELDSADEEYCAVKKQFFLTMDRQTHQLAHIFRVQNPGLWDKYCSVRRVMTPKDQATTNVVEDHLFHGTPTLEAARGICANSFRLSQVWRKCRSCVGQGSLLLHHSSLQSQLHTCRHPRSHRQPLAVHVSGKGPSGAVHLGPSYLHQATSA